MTMLVLRLKLIIYLFFQSERLHKVLDFVSTVHDLCAVLGMDFLGTITEIHPSLNESIGVQSKSISNDTLYKLLKMVEALKEDKRVRLQKVFFIPICIIIYLNVFKQRTETSSALKRHYLILLSTFEYSIFNALAFHFLIFYIQCLGVNNLQRQP